MGELYRCSVNPATGDWLANPINGAHEGLHPQVAPKADIYPVQRPDAARDGSAITTSGIHSWNPDNGPNFPTLIIVDRAATRNARSSWCISSR